MTINLSFISIIALKSAIKEHYKGGLEGFAKEYPTHVHDEHLVGLNFMSQGEADEVMSSLLLNGLLPGRDLGMSERTYGWLMENPNIQINVTFTDDLGFDQYNEAEYVEVKRPAFDPKPLSGKKNTFYIPSHAAQEIDQNYPGGIKAYIKARKEKYKD